MAFSARFIEAIQLINTIHADQVRKGTEFPYISHLLSVAGIIAEYGGSEDQVIAALLHDSLEDQGDKITYEDIKERFGPEVADIVRACSDAEITSTNSEKAPWKERKIAYIGSLRKKPTQTLLVTTADKLHNSRSILRDYYTIGEDLWPRFTGGRDGTLWYYTELDKTLNEVWDKNPILPEFSRVVFDLNEAAQKAA